MQHANQARYTQKPRISLYKHSLYFIQLRSRSLVLSSLVEALGHTRKYLELEVGHRLECDSEGEGGGRAVDFVILRAKIPEFIRKDNGKVIALCAGSIALSRDDVDV
jgi:hypothetical protein